MPVLDGAFRLYAAHPGSGLSRLSDLFHDDGAPYWAHLWPGGAALGRYLCAHPEAVRGRRVLDFGCGGGVVGIAAALAGAEVTCVDGDPMARCACRLNAALNGVALRVAASAEAADVVLAGDVFYDAAVATAAEARLSEFSMAGAEVLVGDIGRAFLPAGRLEEIARFAVRDVGDPPGAALHPGRVFRFC